jgi:hypothetical protein
MCTQAGEVERNSIAAKRAQRSEKPNSRKKAQKGAKKVKTKQGRIAQIWWGEAPERLHVLPR